MSNDGNISDLKTDPVSSMPRRLAAVLFADVSAFSRMMNEDEAGTLREVRLIRTRMIEPAAIEHHGRLIKSMGDGFLVEFTSAVYAVSFALHLQQRMAGSGIRVGTFDPIKLRIGINLGDVVVNDGDIYGDGVNVAARLEAVCEPGGICISDKVHEEARGRVPFVAEDLGLLALKNIDRPVRAWKVTHESAVAAAGPGQSAPRVSKPKVLITPFESIGTDQEQRYFADGVTEDIITELSRFRLLSVVGSASSSSLAEQGLVPRDAGSKLGATYVVKGSVRRSGPRVRIGVQLIDVASGEHVWSERFDRDLEGVFELQDEISRLIAGHLFRNVEIDGTTKAKRKKPDSIAAYDLVLKGMEHHQKQTLKDNDIAETYFLQAINIDPLYAEAHVWVSLIHLFKWSYNLSSDNLYNAVKYATTAYGIDKTSARSAGVLAFSKLVSRDHREAERLCRVAESLNPNDSHITAMSALVYAFIGDHNESTKLFERAFALNPYPPLWYWEHRGILGFAARRYEEPLEWIMPQPLYGADAAYVVSSLGHLGRGDEAAEWLAKHPMLTGAATIFQLARAEPFLRMEDMEHLLDGIRRAGLREA